jgi:hypothetical protein
VKVGSRVRRLAVTLGNESSLVTVGSRVGVGPVLAAGLHARATIPAQ